MAPTFPTYRKEYYPDTFNIEAPTPVNVTPEYQPIIMKACINYSCSRTLVTTSLVKKFNTLRAPLSWVNTPLDGRPICSKNDSSPFSYLEFGPDNEKREYEYFMNDKVQRAVPEIQVGVFEFFFCIGNKHFKVERADVVEGPLFPPSGGPEKDTRVQIDAVLGRDFVDNHPWVLFELGPHGSLVLSGTMQERDEAIVYDLRMSKPTLVLKVAGVAGPGDDGYEEFCGGYGVFVGENSVYNSFRHLSVGRAPSFAPMGPESEFSDARHPPMIVPTEKVAETLAIILALKVGIRMLFLGNVCDEIVVEHHSIAVLAELKASNQSIVEPSEAMNYIYKNMGTLVTIIKNNFNIRVGFKLVPKDRLADAVKLADLGKLMVPYHGKMLKPATALQASSSSSPASSDAHPQPFLRNYWRMSPPKLCIRQVVDQPLECVLEAPPQRVSPRSGKPVEVSPFRELMHYRHLESILPTSVPERLVLRLVEGNLLQATHHGLYLIEGELADNFLAASNDSDSSSELMGNEDIPKSECAIESDEEPEAPDAVSPIITESGSVQPTNTPTAGSMGDVDLGLIMSAPVTSSSEEPYDGVTGSSMDSDSLVSGTAGDKNPPTTTTPNSSFGNEDVAGNTVPGLGSVTDLIIMRLELNEVPYTGVVYPLLAKKQARVALDKHWRVSAEVWYQPEDNHKSVQMHHPSMLSVKKPMRKVRNFDRCKMTKEVRAQPEDNYRYGKAPYTGTMGTNFVPDDRTDEVVRPKHARNPEITVHLRGFLQQHGYKVEDASDTAAGDSSSSPEQWPGEVTYPEFPIADHPKYPEYPEMLTKIWGGQQEDKCSYLLEKEGEDHTGTEAWESVHYQVRGEVEDTVGDDVDVDRRGNFWTFVGAWFLITGIVKFGKPEYSWECFGGV